MILEAKLILGHKPKFNVLLKEGQPFLYFFITGGKIPELKLVRNKRQKGEYFGPFFEKGPARRVYDFLIKTFRLKICKKKIPTGCLYYHMGICSGSCRPDFNLEDYKKRLDLAKLILSGEKSKCLEFIDSLISKHNKNCEFEKSRELYLCKESLEKVSESLDVSSKAHDVRARHDIWVLMTEAHTLFVFKELNGALKKQHEFYIFSLNSQELSCLDYLELYYRTHVPSGSIITNFYISREKINLYQAFFEKYYKILYKVRILVNPESGHDSALLELANVQAQVELDKRLTLGKALGRFLKIKKGILSIDCFDVSHKQGRGLVGACVRFVNGVIEKNKIRYFHIKTLKHQDDYKSLQEIISRRYKDKSEIPDLVVIDGGKGQLSAAREILPSENIIALAKREEIIYSYNFPEGKKLDEKSYAGALLINIRDYAHHSAISFHRKIYKI
jgi:excinuclease ABC subunit C